MSDRRFDSKSTIFDITEAHPETIPVFVRSGFPHVADPERRRAQGRLMSVEVAAKMKGLDAGQLLGDLHAATATHGDVTLEETGGLELLPAGDVRISGLLPCPVRLPLLEFVREGVGRIGALRGRRIGWSLAAASVGADALNRQIAAVESRDDLPEIFISAGFESFFDRRNMLRFKQQGVFTDIAPEGVNRAFEGLGLRDPEGHFTMLGVVPAIFLVNEAELGGEPAPRGWDELLEPKWAGRVALPVGDFDLFNGILLDVERRFGEDGVSSLGRNLMTSLHPSQTVGRFAGRAASPAVSIVPWFFSHMTLGNSTTRVLWPRDGAIVSPIFMLVREDRLDRSRELAEMFLSVEAGKILAHRGRFPVLDPRIDNHVPEGCGFSWLGWDTMAESDLGEAIPRVNRLFEQAVEASR